MKQLENPWVLADENDYRKCVAWRHSEARNDFEETVIKDAKDALIRHFELCETPDEADKECSIVKSNGLVGDYFTVYADVSYTTKYFNKTCNGEPGYGIDKMYFKNIEVRVENPLGEDETFEIEDFCE